MDLDSAWRSVFVNWPEKLPRAGMIVTSTQETIPFVDFLIADSFVIVERDRPDSLGARKVIVALAAITAVKLTSPDALSTLKPFTQAPATEEFGLPAGTPARSAAALLRSADLGRR